MFCSIQMKSFLYLLEMYIRLEITMTRKALSSKIITKVSSVLHIHGYLLEPCQGCFLIIPRRP